MKFSDSQMPLFLTVFPIYCCFSEALLFLGGTAVSLRHCCLSEALLSLGDTAVLLRCCCLTEMLLFL